jgi:hypothetical protein
MNKIQKKMFKIGVIVGIVGLLGCIGSKQLEYDYVVLGDSLNIWFSRVLGNGLGLCIYYSTIYNIFEKKYDDANGI